MKKTKILQHINMYLMLVSTPKNSMYTILPEYDPRSRKQSNDRARIVPANNPTTELNWALTATNPTPCSHAAGASCVPTDSNRVYPLSHNLFWRAWVCMELLKMWLGDVSTSEFFPPSLTLNWIIVGELNVIN